MRRRLPSHIAIPDLQVKPGVILNHAEWIGKYIVEKQPNVVINLGDHSDMPSLSSYDKKTLDFEGRRFEGDVRASHLANDLLTTPCFDAGQWDNTEWHILYGNHENRIERFVQENPELAGFVTKEALEYEYYYDHVHPFLSMAEVDGVTYSHYFYNPMTGRPYGGMIATRLKQIGFSFTQGHCQGADYGMRTLNNGKRQHGLIAGSCYLHREKYLGPQGHDHWNGIVQKYNVVGGNYDIKLVSLDSLCERYEDMPLVEFLTKTDRHIIA